MPTSANLKFQLKFTNLYVDFFKEGSAIVARCPALDLMTYGGDLAEARHNIAEAAECWVEECLRRGTLLGALAECGWRLTGHGASRRLVPPTAHRTTRRPARLVRHERFDVPLPVGA